MNQSSNVQLLSKELIKPSSPAPDHLKTLKLSFLDQFAPHNYPSLIFFYELNSTTDHAQISQHLKQSLSKTLTLYYPLAGKIDAVNFTVDCDHSGVEFIEAQAHSRFRNVMQYIQSDQLQQYLPVSPYGGIYTGEGTILMVQINFFDCGGIAVGVSVSHQIADGWSLVEFMNAWAAICRGEKPKFMPEFGLWTRQFPAKDMSWFQSPSRGNDETVTKRFVFDKEKLEALKETATSEAVGADFVENPTRVEVVSAFIWKHLMENKGEKSLVAIHVVNLRSRTSPFLHLENAVGNGYMITTALNEGIRGIPQLVSKLRRAIRTIDAEYIRESHSEDRYYKDIRRICDLALKGEAQFYSFSSWCRFSFYEVDFGWGIPVRVTPTMMGLNNVTILMATKNGDGIEAWMNLHPNDAESFDNQFNSLVSQSKVK